MSIETTGTVLVIKRRSDNAALLTYYSARGLTQTLTHISAAKQFDISINGALMDFSHSQFRLYESTITCTDNNAPALDMIYPGLEVTVECAMELSYKTSGGSPTRSVVSGSSRVDATSGFTFYRPSLSMAVLDAGNTFNEWGAENGWTIKLQEDG